MTNKRLVLWGGLALAVLVVVLAALAYAGVLDRWGMQAYAGRQMAALQESPRRAVRAAGESPKNPVRAVPSPADTAASSAATLAKFQPPPESSIPDDEFGQVIRRGRALFTDTPRAAAGYVGNSMRCSSCHLDAGRLAGSAPLWAAYVSYPAFRSKTKEVNTFEQRLQGCFQYSMNGTAPPAGDPVLVALQTYSYWLATGAQIDPKIAGRGYPKLPAPRLAPDRARGAKVYEQHCALCHGVDGAGQRTADGHAVFPALWGDDSFNWGAGMGNIDNAAAFIRANMPLGLGGTLSEQDAWDVALFMDSHERPQDPRYTGSVAETRRRFHDTPQSMYGERVDDRVLGDTGPPKRRNTALRATPSRDAR
jgi:thiosulfate dehydrogenase